MQRGTCSPATRGKRRQMDATGKEGEEKMVKEKAPEGVGCKGGGGVRGVRGKGRREKEGEGEREVHHNRRSTQEFGDGKVR